MVDGCVLDLTPKLREKMISRMTSQMGQMWEDARCVAEEYLDLMQQNPQRAIQEMSSFLTNARGESRAYESFCGGPNQDWTTPLFNILGAIYPDLPRSLRYEGIKKVLGFLDGIRNDYASNHIEMIHEPWLVGDVLANRASHYWPGCEPHASFLKKKPSWSEVQESLSKARSKFFFSTAVIAVGWSNSSLPTRKKFYQEHPELTDRTLDGLAAMVIGTILAKIRSPEYDGTDHELDKWLKPYDPQKHDDLKRKMLERKWILLADDHSYLEDEMAIPNDLVAALC